MSSLSSSFVLPLQPTERKSGRAVCSDRGDAVWEWQVATGVFQRDVTDEQLRRLEASNLRIVEFSAPEPRHWSLDTQRGKATPASQREPVTAKQSGPLRQFWARLRST